MNRLLSASGSAAPSTTAVAEIANREAQIAAASAASALNTETRTYLEHTHTMHLLPRYATTAPCVYRDMAGGHRCCSPRRLRGYVASAGVPGSVLG